MYIRIKIIRGIGIGNYIYVFIGYKMIDDFV